MIIPSKGVDDQGRPYELSLLKDSAGYALNYLGKTNLYREADLAFTRLKLFPQEVNLNCASRFNSVELVLGIDSNRFIEAFFWENSTHLSFQIRRTRPTLRVLSSGNIELANLGEYEPVSSTPDLLLAELALIKELKLTLKLIDYDHSK